MLEPGDAAPSFSLPGSHREEIGTFALEDYDDRIVVLVFYPMDFSPACEKELQALREMELFSISDTVDLLAVSADSAYAHRAFAREFDLEFPLLSDRTGDVASRYGVLADEIEGHENVPHRSVFVIDPQQTIRYAWMSEDPSILPDGDEIKTAVQGVSDDGLAYDRFEDGRSKFQYGRSEFENGREALRHDQFELAEDTFTEAVWYFQSATDAFQQSNRYAEDRTLEETAEIAKEKSRRFRQAADWFGEAATRSIDGETELAAEIRADAEDAVTKASEYASIDQLAPSAQGR